MNEPVTREMLDRVLPKSVKSRLTDEMIDNINNLVTDPDIQEEYRDNIISYASVMQDANNSLGNYIEAVRYVSYRLLGDSCVVAYTKSFPQRFQRIASDPVKVSQLAHRYNKGKLVNAIMEQTIIPVHVLNMGLYQKALNVQADLMINAKSDFVKTKAADSILAQLRPPEAQKIELDIGIKEDGSIEELRNTTLQLVEQQKAMLAAGMVNIKQVAESKLLIEGELVDE